MAYLKLLLIRHAQSLGNLQGQMEGQSSTELSAEGHRQAQQLSGRLAQSELPTHIYTSPLLRASQTTHHLTRELQRLGHPFHSEQISVLQEMHQGVFQGLTWAQAQLQYPEVCAQLLSSLTWQPVPQAESLVAARDRAKSWVKHILSQHHTGDIIWAVSHEGFLQQLIFGGDGMRSHLENSHCPYRHFRILAGEHTVSERWASERWAKPGGNSGQRPIQPRTLGSTSL